MIKEIEKKDLGKHSVKKIALEPVLFACEDGSVKTEHGETMGSFGSPANSVATASGVICAGCLDGSVWIKMEDGEFKKMYSHSNNACFLDCSDSELLSGSWDHDAIIFHLRGKRAKETFGHPGPVLCGKLLSDNLFITGCSDGKLRIFCDQKMSKEISYHRSPVRGLLYEEEVIYSVENYGRIHKTSTKGKLLRARCLGTFVYCVCRFKENIVVGGEEGSVFILNNDLEILYKTTVECTSVWDIKADGEKLYISGSGGFAAIFGMGQGGKPFKESAKKARLNDGIFESGGARYKVEEDKVFVEKDGEWSLIGDAVKKYDHTIPVEFGNSKYTLSFNNEDNIYEVAAKFVEENKLDPQFKEDIVNHIQKNCKGANTFKRFETINLSGMEKNLGGHPIVKLLKEINSGIVFSDCRTDKRNIYEIEDAIFEKKGTGHLVPASSIPLFIVLDICKYLFFKKIFIDVSFLLYCQLKTAKEAKAFSMLMANLIGHESFCIDLLDKKVHELLDLALIKDDDVYYYKENKKVGSN